MTSHLLPLALLLLGLGLGYLFGYLVYAVIRKSPADRETRRRLEESVQALHEKEKEISILQTQLKERNDALENLKRDYSALQEKFNTLERERATISERAKHLQEEIEKGKKDLEALLEKNKADFQNLAQSILEEQSRKFTNRNEEKLSEVLKPFRERINEFRDKVEASNRDQGERFSALHHELKSLKELNQQISQDALNLTQALRGESKVQGAWGEMLLEKILEKSGLTAGEEYTTQETYTTGSGEARQRVRPDVIVNLPDNRHIIIDSKVSLKAYTDYANASDHAAAEEAARNHVNSVKTHIKGIALKDYQTANNLTSLDFILVFIPMESAFNLALQRDTDLYDFAFDRNIVIVTPSTLLATLRVIENLWRQEKQNRNARSIAKEAGKLYDKFVAFVEDMNNLNQRLDQARKAFDSAENKLSGGRGNLISRAEKLTQLGARASKSLPANYKSLSNSEDDEIEESEADVSSSK